MVLGGLVVWIELLLRASAIFVGVFFLPFAIVAMIWPRTAATFRRVAEILLAVIFAKFGIVAVVALGGRAIVAAEGDVGQGLAGATILLLACLIPILFLHMAQFAVGAGVMGAAAGVGASAAVAAPMAATRGGMMIAIASRNWGTRAVSRLRGGGDGQSGAGSGPPGTGHKWVPSASLGGSEAQGGRPAPPSQSGRAGGLAGGSPCTPARQQLHRPARELTRVRRIRPARTNRRPRPRARSGSPDLPSIPLRALALPTAMPPSHRCPPTPTRHGARGRRIRSRRTTDVGTGHHRPRTPSGRRPRARRYSDSETARSS